MPLILQEYFPPVGGPLRGELGLWRIDETEEELGGSLELHPREIAQLEQIKGEGRRREFLAARRLLHTMSGRKTRGPLLKDAYGKPHLAGSAYQVSISHTHGLSAAVAHPQDCGVDVQLFVQKISRLAGRFMGTKEAAYLTEENSLILQHLCWSAKEAMYKAYGKKEVDFREHLVVELDNIPPKKGSTYGWLRKDDLEVKYRLDYRIYANDYMLVTAVEWR